MLGKLLKTLKSQKSSKGAIQSNSKIQPKQNNQPIYSITNYKIDNTLIDQQKCVHAKISKIRYYVLPNMPDIFNQVLGCPISVFHHLVHGQRKVKQIDLTKHPYPAYLQFLKPLFQKQIHTYNHLLINDYPPGIGIMPHTDGPAYYPKVYVLSLNSYCIITFQKQYNSGQQSAAHNARILLQPNSIHIFEQQAYTNYLHDCILLKYDYIKKQVVEVNIDNYFLLECRAKIQVILGNNDDEVQMGDLRIVKLIGNQQYTHKIQITRRERISITIREQYK